MKLLVAVVCKSPHDPLVVEGFNYLKKLRHPFSGTPLLINPKSAIAEEHKHKRLAEEGEALLKKTTGYYRLALAEQGRKYSSPQLAAYLNQLSQSTSKAAFLIGGAFGLSADVLKQADATLSLSDMTLPHRLAFLVLCEQLYRAGEIIRGGPYHK